MRSSRWSIDRLHFINVCIRIKYHRCFNFTFKKTPAGPNRSHHLFRSFVQISPISIPNINYDIENSFHLSRTQSLITNCFFLLLLYYCVVIIHSISCRIRRETIHGQIISLESTQPLRYYDVAFIVYISIKSKHILFASGENKSNRLRWCVRVLVPSLVHRFNPFDR